MDEAVAFLDVRNAGEFLDVGTGDETAFLGGYDDRGARRIPGQRLQQRIELEKHAAGENIGGGARLVDRQPHDRVGIPLELPGSRISHRILFPQAAVRRTTASERTWKSQTSGRWSEKRTSGTRKSVTSLPSLTRMKSTSTRGIFAGKDGRPAEVALRSPAARMNR